MSYPQSYSATVTVVPPSSLSKLIFAAMSLGMKTVSFLSPNRYMVEPLVFSMSSSVSFCDVATSVFDLNDGTLPYIPSWNFCPSEEEAILAVTPHDDNMVIAAITRSKLFFILFFYYYEYYFVSSQPVLSCKNCTAKNGITELRIQLQLYG